MLFSNKSTLVIFNTWWSIFYQCAGVGSLHKCQLIPTSDDIHDMIFTYTQTTGHRHHITLWPFHVPWIQKCANFNDHISGQGHTYVIGFSCLKNSAPLSLRQLTKVRPSSKIRTHLQLFYKYGHVHSAKWFGWSLGTDRCPLFLTLLVEGDFNIAEWN